MYRSNFKQIVNELFDEDINKIISPIDCDVILKRDLESFYYIFPLIERIVLEIYKLLPLKDIEHYDQGIMRSIIPIISVDENHYFSDELISSLNKFYGEDGLRNKIFHINDIDESIDVENAERIFDELEEDLVMLLMNLKKNLSNNSIDFFGKIELIK